MVVKTSTGKANVGAQKRERTEAERAFFIHQTLCIFENYKHLQSVYLQQNQLTKSHGM
jgi:hypothetical protein